MSFTITPAAFVRMVQMAEEGLSKTQRGRVELRLVACEGRLCVERAGKVFEAEALIWEDGQCCVTLALLAGALKRQRSAAALKCTADAHGLHLDGHWVPVSHFSTNATLPTAYATYLATDLDVLPPPQKALDS